MRRVGCNPTDVEVRDIIHRIDDDTGGLNFQVGIEEDTSNMLYGSIRNSHVNLWMLVQKAQKI